MLFDRLIGRFQAADRTTRLEALLDHSRKLPDLPERLQASRDADIHRVAECQTPVFLWAEREGDRVHFFADVPRESPTVRGYVSLLVRTMDGATPAEIAAVPDDLLERLRLTDTLGMMRTQGLTAILARVKRLAAAS
ncbi:MAG: SufE family protein [Gemmatimonadota bacterium]|jgi:cysteine desulfuration protein SufE|nr:SufE family protein [Gemmatimonadota bacterium]